MSFSHKKNQGEDKEKVFMGYRVIKVSVVAQMFMLVIFFTVFTLRKQICVLKYLYSIIVSVNHSKFRQDRTKTQLVSVLL